MSKEKYEQLSIDNKILDNSKVLENRAEEIVNEVNRGDIEKPIPENFNNSTLEDMRNEMIEFLSSYDGETPVKLDYDSETIKNLIFKVFYVGRREYAWDSERLLIPKELLKKIDFSDVLFDSVKIKDFDFRELHGVKINLSTIYSTYYDENYFININFSGVEFTGTFNKDIIKGCDFTGSIGAKINPKTCSCNENNKFSGVKFTDKFTGWEIKGCDFTGSNGAVIDFESVRFINNCILRDVTFVNTYVDRIGMEGNDFTGSIGAKINPFKINPYIDLYSNWYFSNNVFNGVEFTGSMDYYILCNNDFTGSKGLKINPKKHRSLIKNNFCDVEFIEPIVMEYVEKLLFEERLFINESNFSGSKGAKIYFKNCCHLKGIKFKDVEFENPLTAVTVENCDFSGCIKGQVDPRGVLIFSDCIFKDVEFVDIHEGDKFLLTSLKHPDYPSIDDSVFQNCDFTECQGIYRLFRNTHIIPEVSYEVSYDDGVYKLMYKRKENKTE